MPNLPPPLFPFPAASTFALDPYYYLLPLESFEKGLVPLPVLDSNPKAFTPKYFPIGEEKCWSLLSFQKLGVDGERRVTDLDHLYPEPDVPLTVSLYVYTKKETYPTPRDRHWAIRWDLQNTFAKQMPDEFPPAARCLELVSNFENRLTNPHLINWGPITSTSRYATSQEHAVFVLGSFTRAERRMMEAIAWQIGVQIPPDGQYNCQNWCTSFFALAISYGLLTVETVNGAMNTALQQNIPRELLHYF
jgi:hypothetical protein